MELKYLIERDKENDISLRSIAKDVGVSLGTVQNVLLGDTEIKNSTLRKFLKRYPNADIGSANKGVVTENIKEGGKELEIMRRLVESKDEIISSKDETISAFKIAVRALERKVMELEEELAKQNGG